MSVSPLKICAACGLANIPERTICKRCHTTLAASVIPPLASAYTGETSSIYYASDHRAVLLISPHILEYTAPEISIRTSWANVQEIAHTPTGAYLVLKQATSTQIVRTGVAPLDEWYRQYIPLQPFGYPTNTSFVTDIQCFIPGHGQAQMPVPTEAWRWIWLLVALPFLLGLLIICRGGSGLSTPTLNLANGLRGNNLLIIRIPRQDQVLEDIEVSKSYIATHSLYQPQTPERYRTSTLTISADLQIALESLRHDWCVHPPVLPQPAARALIYQVAMECGRAANPVFRLLPDHLPPPIATIIQLAPPIVHSEEKNNDDDYPARVSSAMIIDDELRNPPNTRMVRNTHF